MSKLHSSLTCQSLHPGRVVDAQVVVEDAEDVAQHGTQVLGRDAGAAAAAAAVVVGALLPPGGQVGAQHGQDDLDHLGHVGVAGARLGQVADVLQ